MHHMDPVKTYKEKAKRELNKNAVSYIEQIQVATPHKTATFLPPLKPSL